MATKSAKKAKPTDAERHKRFVDMAREVEASEDPKDFDRAFDKVASKPKRARENHDGQIKSAAWAALFILRHDPKSG